MQSFDIYVINLDKDHERLNEISKRLAPNVFIRIPGIYGNEANFDDYNDDLTYFAKNYAPKSAIGTSLSHRKAIKTFYGSSKKDYALILEDDAVPSNEQYMEEVEMAIQNAPSDWDMIKLDYWPNYKANTFNQYKTTMLTAYIINKRGAKKFLQCKTYYHPDVELNGYDMIIYNNPTIVFNQIWDEKNKSNSNNREVVRYNPLNYLYDDGMNFKIFRLFEYEFTIADFLLLLIILFIVVILAVVVRKRRIQTQKSIFFRRR